MNTLKGITLAACSCSALLLATPPLHAQAGLPQKAAFPIYKKGVHALLSYRDGDGTSYSKMVCQRGTTPAFYQYGYELTNITAPAASEPKTLLRYFIACKRSETVYDVYTFEYPTRPNLEISHCVCKIAKGGITFKTTNDPALPAEATYTFSKLPENILKKSAAYVYNIEHKNPSDTWQHMVSTNAMQLISKAYVKGGRKAVTDALGNPPIYKSGIQPTNQEDIINGNTQPDVLPTKSNMRMEVENNVPGKVKVTRKAAEVTKAQFGIVYHSWLVEVTNISDTPIDNLKIKHVLLNENDLEVFSSSQYPKQILPGETKKVRELEMVDQTSWEKADSHLFIIE